MTCGALQHRTYDTIRLCCLLSTGTVGSQRRSVGAKCAGPGDRDDDDDDDDDDEAAAHLEIVLVVLAEPVLHLTTNE